jgi:hypothetical protein
MRPNFRLLPRLLSLPNSVVFLVCLLLNSVFFFFFFFFFVVVLLLLDSVFFLVLVLANSEPISCVDFCSAARTL